ncbi:MAG: hypothetical protein JG718_02670 [Candidatus Thiothrix moscowensis]|nr:hypothetical protein [Candidatus Thiothrix moscowensis]
MTVTVTIEVDEQDAEHSEHFKAVIPSRDADKAWAVRQATNRISAAIQGQIPAKKRRRS